MAFQSLYRRYRPGKFGDLRGQEHVKRALQNAVATDTVSHAYLFSGPRGTGKTTTARILAKAMNCADLQDGSEPCGVCESCTSIDSGSSMDVIELDAASNNGVDAMRDLIARAALGSPGRTKLYILDEVHMLSPGASNALLKTLEEPPGHVVFVLATTDPQKVLPTIRSRTQHYELGLLPGSTMLEHLQWVAKDAQLDVTEDQLALAVRRGKGSARDALSALEQIAAGGGADDDASIDEIVEGLCERDTGRTLTAVATACFAGREPRQLADQLLAHLRDALVATLAPEVVLLPDDAKDAAADQGRRLGNAATVRAMDAIGEAIQLMRESPDPRVALEVALVRCTRPELDTSPAALVERLERLERGAPPRAAAAAAAAPVAEADDAPAPVVEGGGIAAARAAVAKATAAPAPVDRPTLGGLKRKPAAPAPTAPAATNAAPVATGDLPTRDEITTAWADSVLPRLRPTIKAKFSAGRFLSIEDGAAVYAVSGEGLLGKAREVQPQVEAALAEHFGRPVPLRLVVDPGGATPDALRSRHDDAPPPPDPEPEEEPDLSELVDAPPEEHRSGVDKFKEAFGAEEVQG
ncbi:MAG TPA: DNA polymerase III subunit gamma/tau [Acidimicrobiales bacterium]|nr:DNA polymerase III subunit gamma/tau [Acidimicrobiales bacterium]